MQKLVKSIYHIFFQAEDGIRDIGVTGVQTCALPIYEFELRIPRIRGQRPAVAEDDRLPAPPVLVEDVHPVLGGVDAHASSRCVWVMPMTSGRAARCSRPSPGPLTARIGRLTLLRRACSQPPIPGPVASGGRGGRDPTQVRRGTSRAARTLECPEPSRPRSCGRSAPVRRRGGHPAPVVDGLAGATGLPVDDAASGRRPGPEVVEPWLEITPDVVARVGPRLGRRDPLPPRCDRATDAT